VEGVLFLGNSPLPGLQVAVVRRGDGGASVFNLSSAVHTGYHPIDLEDCLLDLGEAMDLPWHTSGRIYDYGATLARFAAQSFFSNYLGQILRPCLAQKTELRCRGGEYWCERLGSERPPHNDSVHISSSSVFQSPFAFSAKFLVHWA
jgi:hypothetical protein